MKHKAGLIAAYSVAHFIVDFACAFLVFRMMIGSQNWHISLLVYNFAAFALQMPIGLLADRWNRNGICAAIGSGLVALAFLFGDYAILSVLIAGVGNGLFHVGGGIDVLNVSKDKPILLGIFVSPGAIGIYLGTMLGKQATLSVFVVVSVLILIMLILLMLQYIEKRNFRSVNVLLSFEGLTSPKVLVAIGSLLLVVILRSYIGMTSTFNWKSSAFWAMLYVGAIAFGKIGGGILAAIIGLEKTSIISLSLAAVFFLFSDHPVLGIAAVFFFNMTMPLTLWAVAKLLAGSKGFSFGLLTFGLFLGFLPSYLELKPLFFTTIGFSLVTILSLGLLLFGIRRAVP